jgi:hypothetical protein
MDRLRNTGYNTSVFVNTDTLDRHKLRSNCTSFIFWRYIANSFGISKENIMLNAQIKKLPIQNIRVLSDLEIENQELGTV